MIYDPPSGWLYGFPKAYKPLKDETLEETLIRDGYPEEMAKTLSKYTRFMGTPEELEGLRDVG